ncbi:MAG: DUF4421 domain-containing protein [Flavobacteriales bacterium]|nr:DUF4421 domain-containing protein [Flavobacteriales bacterium]MBP9080880.1 DUF4421 domain-containing protein [Flavobacteriales bacterium]
MLIERHLSTRRLLALFFPILWPSVLHAQTQAGRNGFDTAFVRDYSRLLTTRFYISTKYNLLELNGPGAVKDLVYRPNSKINFGLGASYRALTLNIGVGIPGLNQDEDKRGETRYLDAQANIHTKHWATNFFLQRFQGYYLSSHTLPELGWVQATAYPTRPDLVQFNLGASTVYIHNNDRFSYRAAFNQDAWQRRSQGSLLVGGYFTYFRMNADSSIVPDRLTPLYSDGLQLRRGGFVDLGPTVGYAYTLVLREHFFLTGSGVMGGGISLQRATTESSDGAQLLKSGGGLGWHGQFRAGAGYNSARYFVGLSFNQENIGYLLDERSSFSWSVGNIRLNLAKRFDLRLKPLRGTLGLMGL